MNKPVFNPKPLAINSLTNKQLLSETGQTIYELKKAWGMKANEIYVHLNEIKNDEVKQYNIKTQKDNEKLLKKYIKDLAKWNQEQEDIKNEALLIKKKTKEELNKVKKSLKTNLINIHIDKIKEIDLNLNVLKYVNPEEILKLILELIGKINYGEVLFIKINEITYALNDLNRERLMKLIFEEVSDGITTSDSEFLQTFTFANKVSIFKLQKLSKYKKSNGAFFAYMNKTHFDLSDYGIYKTFDNKNYIDTCLVLALKMGGLEEDKLDLIRMSIKSRNIPICKLNDVCDLIKIQIHLKSKSKEYFIKYGTQYERIFEIGLIEDHYFIINKTNITSYCIENYEEVKNEKECNFIYKKRDNSYRRDKTRCIDSYVLILLLVNNKEKLLELYNFENSNIASSQYYDKVSTDFNILPECKNERTSSSGDYIYDFARPTGATHLGTDEKEDNYYNVFFDFETYVEDGKHKPYLCCCIDQDGNKKSFIGDKCGYNLLKYISSKSKFIRLIAHNANYDYRFLIEYLYCFNEISRGSKLISASGKFNGIDIEIKCSYHLISMPLKDFSKVFKLTDNKEVMPYDLYNVDGNIKKRFIDIKEALEYVKDDEKVQFLLNIKKWNLSINGKYDIVEYSRLYCELDCEVLKQGYTIFREWMQIATKIDINQIATIASLSHRYLCKEGCYKGVYELSGIPQKFIQKCVVGGRTMIANNKKNKLVDDSTKIQDFDAVSLYPSAMNRMDGFLKGVPKVIKNLDYNDLKLKDGYFVEIKIKSIGIKRAFPLISKVNIDGVRVFSNDLIGEHIHIDKIALEDLIIFQDVDFEIIKGYYFDEGFNTQIKTTITFLFDERLKKKNEKNAIELVYKLIMNSGYGKSIMKEIETETKIFDNQVNLEIFLERNYNWIKSFNSIDGCKKTKVQVVKPINTHFNIPQVGVSILSMSKRIMNEVMCLSEDNGINIYYQDTDSMHIDECNIEKLSNLFSEKYSRNLIGKALGQFHSDFDFKGCKDIYASRSIFLGKKCYIDKLQGTDEKTGENKTSYHIRMKGIPNSCIEYTCNKLNYSTPFEMYEDLYNGKEISFDLTQEGKKANFKFNKDYSINTLTSFMRRIKF